MTCISSSSLDKSIAGRTVIFPFHQITSYLGHGEGSGFAAEANASAHADNALIFLANLEQFITVLGVCSNLGCLPKLDPEASSLAKLVLKLSLVFLTSTFSSVSVTSSYCSLSS